MGPRPLLADGKKEESSFDRSKGPINWSRGQRNREAHQKAETIVLRLPAGVVYNGRNDRVMLI